MKYYCVYKKQTGQIVRSGVCPDNMFDLQIVEDDEKIIESKASWEFNYIKNGIVLQMPNKPSNFHVFDYLKECWIPNFDLADFDIKNKRNQLLQQSDWTQIPNNPLTPDQQQQWAVYRQELRDITTQSGYPFNVVWPTPPQG